jgi:hypothetical protein
MVRSGLSAAEVARQLGMSAATVWTWAKNAAAEDWARTVDPHFGFLLERGFEPQRPRLDGWWSVVRAYRSADLEIEVVESRESNAVEVTLRPLAWSPDRRARWCDELLRERAPQLTERRRTLTGLQPGQVTAALEFWAGCLQEQAADLLAGDLRWFDAS